MSSKTGAKPLRNTLNKIEPNTDSWKRRIGHRRIGSFVIRSYFSSLELLIYNHGLEPFMHWNHALKPFLKSRAKNGKTYREIFHASSKYIIICDFCVYFSNITRKQWWAVYFFLIATLKFWKNSIDKEGVLLSKWLFKKTEGQ